MKRILQGSIGICILIAICFGCQPKEEKISLLISAAASLEYSLEEQIIPMFEELNPQIHVRGTYDSSGKLQTQIEEGIEADLFLSAATMQMDTLVEKDLVEADSVVNLLENKVVVITAADSKLEIVDFSDLIKANVIAIGDPNSVPVGQYSKEALENLGIWNMVQSKASFGSNVTEMLHWVVEGSAEAGIVYATDAATTDQVKIVAKLPAESLSTPVVYPVGIITATKHREEAKQFLAFLQTEKVLEVFEEYGFSRNQD